MFTRRMTEDEYLKSLDELEDMTAFWDDCEQHLEHARQKHPHFASKVLKRSTELANEYLAVKHKKDIAESDALEDVLLSELHEFLVEMERGNAERAREEAADIVAVILRALLGDIKRENDNR